MSISASLQSHLQELSQQSFNWSNLHSYFPFSDVWREGEYQKLLAASLASIYSLPAKADLLAALDLQYAVLLEQLSIQQVRTDEVGADLDSAIFGERVMGYLQINSNMRSDLNISASRSASSAFLDIPQGKLWNRLFD